MLMAKFLRFLWSENVFVLLLFLNNIFSEYRILILQLFFFFQYLKFISPSGLRGFRGEFSHGLYYAHNMYLIYCFSCCFQDILFIFDSNSLIIIQASTGIGYQILFCFMCAYLSVFEYFYLISNLDIFGHYFLNIFFCSILSILFF